jgi:hypothetical protein
VAADSKREMAVRSGSWGKGLCGDSGMGFMASSLVGLCRRTVLFRKYLSVGQKRKGQGIHDEREDSELY